MRKAYIAAVMVLALCSTAQALILTPGGEFLSGNQTGTSAIESFLFTTYGIDTTLAYKSNAGGGEEGPFAGDYMTTFIPSSGDAEGGSITWLGPGYITDPGYLLVKDGNQEPAWYLFDIMSWNGKETIELQNFWPQQGAISHVSIYGGGESPPPPVPEPATMLLFGTGLVGLAGLARRKRQ